MALPPFNEYKLPLKIVQGYFWRYVYVLRESTQGASESLINFWVVSTEMTNVRTHLRLCIEGAKGSKICQSKNNKMTVNIYLWTMYHYIATVTDKFNRICSFRCFNVFNSGEPYFLERLLYFLDLLLDFLPFLDVLLHDLLLFSFLDLLLDFFIG